MTNAKAVRARTVTPKTTSAKTPKGKGHQNLNDWDTLRLWVASGGRCELCNKLMTQSPTTHHELNLGQRAHIIGQGGAKSPRHDPVLSETLASSIDNIMLLCLDCHKEIDSPAWQAKYPVLELQRLKAAHEERIQYLTSLDALKTRVVAFQTHIQQNQGGENSVLHASTMHKPELHDAILPDRFPDRDDPTRITISLPTEESQAHWEELQRTINRRYKNRFEDEPEEHLSIFALGKIPAIVYFGHLIGSTRSSKTMNVQQGGPVRWKRKDQVPETFRFEVNPEELVAGPQKQVVLLISLTGLIEKAQYSEVIPEDAVRVEIRLSEAHRHPDWLVAEHQLAEFKRLYVQQLSAVQSIYGQDSTVHLLIAAPTPVVLEIGRQYRQHFPKMLVYSCINKKFSPAFYLGGTE